MMYFAVCHLISTAAISADQKENINIFNLISDKRKPCKTINMRVELAAKIVCFAFGCISQMEMGVIW